MKLIHMDYFGVSWLEDGAKFNLIVTKRKKKKTLTGPKKPAAKM